MAKAPPDTGAHPDPAAHQSVLAASEAHASRAASPPATEEQLPDPARLANMLQRLSEIAGDGEGAVSRLALTADEREAHRVVAGWMADLGLTVAVDAFGNTIGTLPGQRADLPALGIGSHLDSVPQGGRFDGVVGVVAGLEVVRLLTSAGRQLQHPLKVIAFVGEEGARFGEACLGSKAVVGQLQPGDLQRLRDADGVTLGQALQALDLDPRQLPSVRWAPNELAAFLELHIEQGRLLESEGKAIGLVEAVAGNTRLRLRVLGRADHSGGTPMHVRRDALTAAAEIVLGIEQLAREPRRRTTVATVGRLDVWPNSITTVPARVTFYVDVRDVDGDRQREAAQDILTLAQQVAARRGVGLEAEKVGDSSPVVLPLWLRQRVRDVCNRLGVSHRVLNSGAGHDAAILARLLPAAMVFVPSHQGLSHCPEEWTSIADIATGVRVLYHTILALDEGLLENNG
ncbi:MAG: Zn-dependent hydrolase [Chloroflexi bacterium]|nr:Zn-dependent hydrolase [Chloroflexota bacterium]